MHIFSCIALCVFLTSCRSSKKSSYSEGESINFDTNEREQELRSEAFDISVDLTEYLRKQRGLKISGSGGSAEITLKANASLGSTPGLLYMLDGRVINDYATLYSIVSVDDIQSVRVLKDRAETAFYGSKGANGVVLIKTKK